jgi:hypothetical protein
LFWDKISLHSFTSVLSIIDASTRMLWVLCTPNKHPPLAIIDYFLHMIQHKGLSIHTIHVDEDGALACSSEFANFLLLRKITLDTTGG